MLRFLVLLVLLLFGCSCNAVAGSTSNAASTLDRMVAEKLLAEEIQDIEQNNGAEPVRTIETVIESAAVQVTEAPSASLLQAATTVSFNETKAKQLVVYSAYAYCNQQQRQTCADTFVRQHRNNTTEPIHSAIRITHSLDAQFRLSRVSGLAAVDDTEKSIVLSFRGTTTATQLLGEMIHSQAEAVNFTSLNSQSNTSTAVRFDKYFYDAYDLLHSQVISALQQLLQQHPDYSVEVTGHSLGGALAVICTYRLLIEGHLKTQPLLITFGQPRVGDFAFAQRFNELLKNRAWRVTHAADPVPQVPPCARTHNDKPSSAVCSQEADRFHFAYHHGTEVYYSQENMGSALQSSSVSGADVSYTICSVAPFGEDPRCSFSVNLRHTVVDNHLFYYSIRPGSLCESYVSTSDSSFSIKDAAVGLISGAFDLLDSGLRHVFASVRHTVTHSSLSFDSSVVEVESAVKDGFNPSIREL